MGNCKIGPRRGLELQVPVAGFGALEGGGGRGLCVHREITLGSGLDHFGVTLGSLLGHGGITSGSR